MKNIYTIFSTLFFLPTLCKIYHVHINARLWWIIHYTYTGHVLWWKAKKIEKVIWCHSELNSIPRENISVPVEFVIGVPDEFDNPKKKNILYVVAILWMNTIRALAICSEKAIKEIILCAAHDTINWIKFNIRFISSKQLLQVLIIKEYRFSI